MWRPAQAIWEPGSDWTSDVFLHVDASDCLNLFHHISLTLWSDWMILKHVGVTSDFRSHQILFIQKVRLECYFKEEQRVWTETLFKLWHKKLFFFALKKKKKERKEEEPEPVQMLHLELVLLLNKRLIWLDIRLLWVCLGCHYFNKLVEKEKEEEEDDLLSCLMSARTLKDISSVPLFWVLT